LECDRHEFLGPKDRPHRERPGPGIHAEVIECPERGIVATRNGPQRIEQLVGEAGPLRGAHAKRLRPRQHEVLAVFFHAQVQVMYPLHVWRHAVEVEFRSLRVPGDVNDPKGDPGVPDDDVVDDRGDAALEIGIGRLGHDGHVHLGVLVDGARRQTRILYWWRAVDASGRCRPVRSG
jgi:hypothetical protein